MSKQDASKMASAPPPQYAYGAPLQQQYGSQPPPYSAQPSAQPYAAHPAYQAMPQASAYAPQTQSPYLQQQYVAMPQVQLPHGYVPPPASAYPRQQYMPAIPPQAHAMPQGPPPPYQPVAQPMMFQQPQTVVVGGAFDAGARFDSTSQPRIPPPPPGVAPNAAQMAAMQGHTVVGTQQRSNWFTGGSGGGATLF